MKDHNPPSLNKKTLVHLILYKPEDEIFQRLHFCKYLSELPKITQEGTENQALDKKDQETHP